MTSNSNDGPAFAMGSSGERAATLRAPAIHELAANYTGRDGQIRLLHEELALHWVVNANDLSMTNSWFIFDMIVKSMIEHLDWTGTLNSPRKCRFSHQFNDDLTTIVNMVATKVITIHQLNMANAGHDTVKPAQSLNASLAFFLFDLLSIMDRGFVFGLVNSYYKIMLAKISSNADLIHYKLDLLRIICSHEHFVALNLPFGTPYTALSAPSSPTPSVASNTSQNSYMSTMVRQNGKFLGLTKPNSSPLCVGKYR